MKKEIAIIKNGFDILRIIEGKNDKYTCEFVIEPMIDIDKIRIFAMPLFSDVQHIPLEKNCKLHITYHRSTLTKPTKIHLRMEFEDGQVKYETLPLNNLLDPNINTEIPIPLMKLIVPDNVLSKKYTPKSKHRPFDIKNSNIIEIFMTKSNFKSVQYYKKWDNMYHALIENSFQYMATGLTKYIGLNLSEQLQNGDEEHVAAIHSDVTNNIGIFINTVKSIWVSAKTMDFLFIDNAAYLGFIGRLRHFNEDHPKGKLTYKLDIEKEDFFSPNERRKWEYIFGREFEKLNKLIKNSDGKYERQINNEKRINQEKSQIGNRVLKFKDKIKKYYEQSDQIEKLLLKNASLINIVLAKYLEIEEPVYFSTQFIVEEDKSNGEKYEFEEILLFYKDYWIDMLYEELNIYFMHIKDGPEIIIGEEMSEEALYKKGYNKSLLLKDNIKVSKQGFYVIPKEKMKKIFNDKENSMCKLYDKIMS